MSPTSASAARVLAAALLVLACAEAPEPTAHATVAAPLTAYCTATVIGKGVKDVETDYLPRVIRCENGSAPLEALKAQAVAARSYLYYKLNTSGSVADGTSDQVYTCAAQPSAVHYQAVNETAGQVLRYKGTQVAAFYVAGAVPTAASCVAKAGDNDYSSTEKFVTYNWGKSGSGLVQTTLGWVNAGNYANRGCKSQNGASCLAKASWGYQDILKFYYGMDIELVTATGSCVQQCECSGSATETQACGNCGTRTRTCNGCTWGGWSGCGSQGVCAPGATESGGCGNCGSQSRTCGASCAWGGWSACVNGGPCAPGASESEACGLCGARARSCGGTCTWGAWGACGGEGVCAPGTPEHRDCAECGVETRLCGADCQWPAFGACVSVDPTAPDASALPCRTPATGVCGAGSLRCLGGTVTCVAESTATGEVCNDLDDDCDGQTDEDEAPLAAFGAPPYAAEIEGFDAPASAAVGAELTLTLTVRNEGSAPWAANSLRLRLDDATTGGAARVWHPSWESASVVARNPNEVPPGDAITFEVHATAPADAVTTLVRLVHDNGLVRCPSASREWLLVPDGSPPPGPDADHAADVFEPPSDDTAGPTAPDESVAADRDGPPVNAEPSSETQPDAGGLDAPTPLPPADGGGCNAGGRSAPPTLLLVALLGWLAVSRARRSVWLLAGACSSAAEPAVAPTGTPEPMPQPAAPAEPLACSRAATRLSGLSTEVRGIVLRGDRAYVSDDYGGFRVFDLPADAAPVLRGWLPEVVGLGRGLSLDGDTAWLASADAGIYAIDVADPAVPRIVSNFDLPGYTRHIVVRGDTAYAADDWFGFHLIDVSDRAAPKDAGWLQEARPCFRLMPDDQPDGTGTPGLVWVASGYEGIHLIDTRSGAPVIAHTIDTPGHAWDVLLDGRLLWVADDVAGVAAYDVTTPETPRLVSALDTPGHARSLVAVTPTDGKRRLFLADGTAGLPPVNPPDPGGGIDGDPSGEGGLVRIDISDPTRPVIDGTANTSGYALTLNGDAQRILVGVNVVGLLVFDPTTLARTATFAQVPGWSTAVAAAGDWAFIATRATDGSGWLRSVTVGDPKRPVERAATPLPATPLALSLELTEDRATVWGAAGSAGLLAVDVTAPNLPAVTASPALAGDVNDVVASAHGLFAATSEGVWRRGDDGAFARFGPEVPAVAVDPDPTRVAVGTAEGVLLLDADGAPVATVGVVGVVDVSVEGPHVAVTRGEGGAAFFTESDGTLQPLGALAAPSGEFRGVEVVGQMAFLSGYDPVNHHVGSGLRLVDLSGEAPADVGFLNLAGPIERLEVHGRRVFAAATRIGLQIMDVDCAATR